MLLASPQTFQFPGYQNGVLICFSDSSIEAPVLDAYFVLRKNYDAEIARENGIFFPKSIPEFLFKFNM